MDREFALDLGKLILAAAWADGCIQDEELDILNDVILKLPELNDKDRATLNIYLEYPISDREREQILTAFKLKAKTEEDRKFALKTVKDVMESCGEVTENEEKTYEYIREQLEEKSSSFVSIGRSIKKIIQPSTKTVTPDREKYLDEFLTNPIYFSIKNSIKGETRKHYVDLDLKGISITLALMIGVAQIDGAITFAEEKVIEANIIRYWRIKPYLSDSITLMGLKHSIRMPDTLRFADDFQRKHSEDDCLRIYTLLMDTAKADGAINAEELSIITKVADVLKLEKSFVDGSVADISV